MVSNGHGSSGKRPYSKYDKGEDSRPRKRQNSRNEHNLANPKATDTIYRILSPKKKIGGVIGTAGMIINALRAETHAIIRVADSIPGADERVVVIYSSPHKKDTIIDQGFNVDSTKKEGGLMDPHCPAQDALLRVHERIMVEEDQGGSPLLENNDRDVMARLLVPSGQVGCLLGKGGSIIQKLRSDTGANIRILPAELLANGVMSTDELVQISGSSAVVKKALYEVSTLLHQNPRKENSSSAEPHGYNPPPMLPQRHPMWSHPNAREPEPWFPGQRAEMPGFTRGGFNPGPAGGEKPDEFSVKILCSSVKIGGVIGKGGGNVRQLEHETGARIHVESVESTAEERMIIVSSLEALRDRLSPTVEAIIRLQNKISEISEKGTVTTRLLIPSSKVGCLLGGGGRVITEMRRRTGADIRIYSRNDKSEHAVENEEVVQISGNPFIAKEALLEILLRVRERSLRGASAVPNPPYVGPSSSFWPSGGFQRELPSSHMNGPGNYRGYDHRKSGEHMYEDQHDPPTGPTASGYPNSTTNGSSEGTVPATTALPSVVDLSGRNMSNINQVSSTKQDPLAGSSECTVQIIGSSDQTNTAHSHLGAYIAAGGCEVAPAPVPQQ